MSLWQVFYDGHGYAYALVYFQLVLEYLKLRVHLVLKQGLRYPLQLFLGLQVFSSLLAAFDYLLLISDCLSLIVDYLLLIVYY